MDSNKNTIMYGLPATVIFGLQQYNKRAAVNMALLEDLKAASNAAVMTLNDKSYILDSAESYANLARVYDTTEGEEKDIVYLNKLQEA